MNKIHQLGTGLALAGLLLAGPLASAQTTTTQKSTTKVVSHGTTERVAPAKKTVTISESATQTTKQDATMAPPPSAPMTGTASGNTRAGGVVPSPAGVMVGGAMMLPSRDIVDNAALSQEHTTLVKLVQTADLATTLKGTGPFTVFAPTNEAFEMLPAGTADRLTAPAQRAKLRYVLNYHVVPGKLMAADLVDGQQLATVGSGTLTVVKKDGQTMLRDEAGHMATIKQADVVSANGVTHVIDTVLMPKM